MSLLVPVVTLLYFCTTALLYYCIITHINNDTTICEISRSIRPPHLLFISGLPCVGGGGFADALYILVLSLPLVVLGRAHFVCLTFKKTINAIFPHSRIFLLFFCPRSIHTPLCPSGYRPRITTNTAEVSSHKNVTLIVCHRFVIVMRTF